MKKILLIIIIFSLTIPIQAKANEQDDFNQLMQYDGYAKATYENTVKLKAYLHGKYTNTQEYVYQTFSEIGGFFSPSLENKFNELRQYIDSNEPLISADLPFKDKVLAVLIGTGSNLYTWGAMAVDIVGDIFGLGKEELEANAPINYESISESLILTVDGTSATLTANVGYSLLIQFSGWQSTNQIRFQQNPIGERKFLALVIPGNSAPAHRIQLFDSPNEQGVYNYINSMTYATAYADLIRSGAIVTIKRNSDNTVLTPTNTLSPQHNTFFNTVNENYYDVADNTIKNLVSIKMYCSNEILDLNYSNGEFKYLDTVISVNKDTMIANYDGENCTVGFVANEIKYIADKVVVVTSDEIIDTETGDITNSDGEVIKPNTTIPECDGVMCWLLNIFKTIADVPYQIAKAILGLFGNVIELFKDMFVFLFVPSVDSFNGFINELNTTMNEKFNLTAFTNVFNEMTPNTNARSVSPATSNVFDGVTVSGLMGTGEVKIIDSTTINAMLPTIHSWIKGFFYVLLAFFNINHLYKLIRGTTIFESMRGKSE